MKFIVVVLPMPVGPVTRISPLGRRGNSRTTSGKPSSSAERTTVSQRRIAISGQPLCK